MPAPSRYRIIYNWDGAPHGYSEWPQSMTDFLEKTYAPLEDTQVDALFWCVGEHAARWESQVLETLGDVHGRRYENAYTFVFTENIRAMMERGEDPQAALIKRGHELGLHVYASIRMNDNHFDGAQVKDLATLHHTELTRMRILHPEWLLGDRTSEWFALSWNFEIPEVREHRFAHIREICERYDWDGVELDWQRHAFHLPKETAYRMRYVMTDLQRAVRRMTDELATRRGRPFYLAARVAGTLDMCRNIGYDIPVWIREGLVDMLIPAGGAATDPSLDVPAFVDLCKDTGVAVYPGFDGALPDPFVGPEDAATKDRMRTRAIAGRYHEEGTAGIYVFNWHANRMSRRELLTQVGAAETLRKTDKIYAATHRFLWKEGAWRGAYDNDRTLGEVPTPLKRTLTGDGPTVTMNIADDVEQDGPTRVELRVRLDQWVRGDVVRVLWDGVVLERPDIRYCAMADPERLSDVSSAVWLCWTMDPMSTRPGAHTAQVVLESRHPAMGCDLILTDVELVIRYGPAVNEI
jgi:hypothetical protein